MAYQGEYGRVQQVKTSANLQDASQRTILTSGDPLITSTGNLVESPRMAYETRSLRALPVLGFMGMCHFSLKGVA